ncbi:lipopolysaccharide biosynthesis protein [Mongoliitalea daihaiensis]|uniref:lipopolysaccharide biosynthesis protein n=1 Tax=Mongoliitalea daihaiensis TaxID=2782006 RepID=UPI001F282D3E|nr:polysaccharide biosynthesis C-terminal domain-containing protein [Mongoliitalea daihaiensis]UJP63328.1 polysaccharide biosynthesis C-terminal domain-containing protein [Mongoliitalea daihaiensis]
MGQLRKLAGQTAIYGISSILGRTVNFLLIPLYTAYLSKEGMGAYTALYANIALFNVVFTYGMETTYFRFATGKGLDPTKVYHQIQSLLITSSLSLGALIYFSAPWFAEVLNYPGQEYLFRWIAWILAIDAILAIPYARLRKENKSLQFALTKFSNILINVGLNILFIVVFKKIHLGDWLPGLQEIISKFYQPDWEVEYILLSNLIANALMVPVLFKYMGGFSFQLNRKYLSPMWHYAFPLLFMGLAGVVNEAMSRNLFEHLIPNDFYPGLTGREAGGIFGANFKLAILMNLIIQAFKYAAEPFFFNQSTDKNSPALFARVMHVFILFCSTLMIAVSVNLGWLGNLLLRNEGYSRATYIVPVLLMGYLLLGIYFNLSIWFKLTDKTKYSFYITFIGAIVTMVILLVTIPSLGFMGGALSTLGCYLVMSILCYWWGQKHFPIPYQTGKGVFYLFLAFVFSYAGYYVSLENPLVEFILQNSFIVLFVGIVLIIEKKELQQIIQQVNQKKS